MVLATPFVKSLLQLEEEDVHVHVEMNLQGEQEGTITSSTSVSESAWTTSEIANAAQVFNTAKSDVYVICMLISFDTGLFDMY
jgi:hypothetical protein